MRGLRDNRPDSRAPFALSGDRLKKPLRTMSRSKRIWLAVGTTTLLIAVTAIVTGRIPGCGPNDWLAAYLGGHLTSVPDELVAAEMRQIAALDEVGLYMLLDALGSSRPSVADAAAATLHEQLDEWEKLPRERSSQPVARVASELARRVDSWPDPARCVAADLALRILDWPIDNRQVPRATLIADCEYVMRTQQGSSGSTTSPGAPAGLSPIENAVRPEAARDDRGSVSRSARTASGASADWDTAPTPGGDLPISETELPPVTASLAEFSAPSPAEDHEPDMLPPSRSNGVPSASKMSLSDEPQPVPAHPRPTCHRRVLPSTPRRPSRRGRNRPPMHGWETWKRARTSTSFGAWMDTTWSCPVRSWPSWGNVDFAEPTWPWPINWPARTWRHADN